MLDRFIAAEARRSAVSRWREAHHLVRHQGKAVLLYKPRSFMNACGDEVAQLMRHFRLSPERLLVIHDDLDLPLGRLQARFGGGDAGHRGLRSLSERLGSKEYYRLRVGIGRPPAGIDAADYVLRPFAGEETELLAQVLECAEVDLIRLFDAMLQGDQKTWSVTVAPA